MNVLSLFDGISSGRVALERAGIKVDRYFASEVDKYAIQVSQKNYPDIERLVDVCFVSGDRLPKIDLMLAGPPCQDLSVAGKRKGLNGSRSGLFWEVVRLIKECKPTYFLVENVASMKKEDKQTITDALGVEPIMINSALVSAQQRKRLYWTNIPNVTQPEDKGIVLKDILETGDTDRLKSYCIDANYYKGGNLRSYFEKGRRQLVFDKPDRVGNVGGSTSQANRVYSTEGKSVSLSANGGGGGAKTGLYKDDTVIRKLTPVECERLQTLPDGYTDGISNTQRYKCLGNGWTVDAIAHILKEMK